MPRRLFPAAAVALRGERLRGVDLRNRLAAASAIGGRLDGRLDRGPVERLYGRTVRRQLLPAAPGFARDIIRCASMR